MQPNIVRNIPRVKEVIDTYGRCIELVPLDPHFNEISVGFYERDGVVTVWTYNQIAGVDKRIEQIRNQLVRLGGMEALPESHNQARFPCGPILSRPVKFLAMQAVEKNPDFSHGEGAIITKDLKSQLNLKLIPEKTKGLWVYEVTSDEDDKRKAQRLRAVAVGMIRYGEMEKIDATKVAFPGGCRNDPMARLLLPYARNISRVQDMLDDSALRGQMTTDTLGFSQT